MKAHITAVEIDPTFGRRDLNYQRAAIEYAIARELVRNDCPIEMIYHPGNELSGLGRINLVDEEVVDADLAEETYAAVRQARGRVQFLWVGPWDSLFQPLDLLLNKQRMEHSELELRIVWFAPHVDSLGGLLKQTLPLLVPLTTNEATAERLRLVHLDNELIGEYLTPDDQRVNRARWSLPDEHFELSLAVMMDLALLKDEYYNAGDPH